MRIALIAPPFIEIPPRRYGGTELFVANLACALHARGHSVTVYGNGDSQLPCPIKSRYPHAEWPLEDPLRADLKNADHTAWSMRDAAASSDVIHLNDVVGVPVTMFVDVPTALTIHHPSQAALSEQYMKYPDVHYVTIARWLARREPMPHVHVVHHGIPVDDYVFSSDKDDYVAFLGRMVPCKGAHVAIEAACLAGVHLKLAGEIQPQFRDYWHTRVRPLIDGRQVEYIGAADRALKNALLSRARALLFPIEWEEPFGLVMIEAMACGTPVLAFAGGAVEEVVRNGVNGWICRDVAEMAARLSSIGVDPRSCRDFVCEYFSVGHMADRYLEVYAQTIESRAAVRGARVQA